MTWAKLDDTFWMHPKVMMSGNAAAGIFARMLAYSGCYLTDGLIPADIVKMIVGGDSEAFERLVKHDMLEELPTGSVFIGKYLEHNRSKREVDQDRKTRRENGARGGRPKKAPA